MQLPDQFRVACYRFDLEAIDPLYLPPYKGSTLRGGFGYAFKKMVCQQPDWGACNPCQGGNDCPYGYIFETSVPEDSQVLRNLRAVPLPFVIEPPLDERREYHPGDRLDFGLVLVGKAINYLPYFILAFQELGRNGIGKPRGRYSLQRITAIHPWDGRKNLVYDGVDVRVGEPDLSLTSQEIVQQVTGLPTDHLTLEFLSPAQLKHQGKFATEPKFHIIVRTLLRRLSSLSYFHCDQQWETDYPGLIAAAEEVALVQSDVRWADWERFSGRQKKRLNMGGIVGSLTYKGALKDFLPLILLGELIHTGKATVFGNGKYRLVTKKWPAYM